MDIYGDLYSPAYEHHLMFSSRNLSEYEYSGICSVDIVEQNVEFGDLLYFDFSQHYSNPMWRKANALSYDTMIAKAVALEDTTSVSKILILFKGFVYNPNWDIVKNEYVYVSEVSGKPSIEYPTIIGSICQNVGRSDYNNIIEFHFEPLWMRIIS